MATKNKKEQGIGFGGKRIRNARVGLEAEKAYTLDEAISLVKERAKTKFDETVEVALNLGVDPRHSDQIVRGVIGMPNGLGKDVRVAVFARDDKAEEAKKAGADLVGADDLVEKILGGEMNFDRCIATPDMMPVVGKVAKVLGPRGLMPNPKLGTVTQDIAAAVKDSKSGQVEYRTEKGGILHVGIGKASFETKALIENIKTFIDAVRQAKPSGVKGVYMEKMTLSSTMGPSVKVDVASVADAA